MEILSDPPHYRVYLLTVWRDRSRSLSAADAWRFRLEDPRTGKLTGFTSAEALMEALQIADTSDGNGDS